MKKLFTLSLLFVSSLTFAQQQLSPGASANQAYNKGDKILQAGLGFGYFNYGFAGSRSVGLPPLTASLELGIHDHISVGPYIGYASWKYSQSYSGISANYNMNFFSLGARGSFHYLPLLNEHLDLDLDEEKIDFYASLFLGLEMQRMKSESKNEDHTFKQNLNSTGLRLAPVLGFKYKFNPKFGAYLEVGRGALSVATLGGSINL